MVGALEQAGRSGRRDWVLIWVCIRTRRYERFAWDWLPRCGFKRQPDIALGSYADYEGPEHLLARVRPNRVGETVQDLLIYRALSGRTAK